MVYLPTVQAVHSEAPMRFDVLEKVDTGHGVGTGDCMGQNDPENITTEIGLFINMEQ